MSVDSLVLSNKLLRIVELIRARIQHACASERERGERIGVRPA
jgi:hypothetical protein